VQGHFFVIESTAEKNGKSAVIEQEKDGRSRLFNRLAR
jgi:hypothetical protein